MLKSGQGWGKKETKQQKSVNKFSSHSQNRDKNPFRFWFKEYQIKEYIFCPNFWILLNNKAEIVANWQHHRIPLSCRHRGSFAALAASTISCFLSRARVLDEPYSQLMPLRGVTGPPVDEAGIVSILVAWRSGVATQLSGFS
jgi:hypothetical protein